MTAPETVVVLAGGLSHERDVSLRSGRRVASALRDAGYDVLELDVNASLVATLSELGNPVIVPVLHGGVAWAIVSIVRRGDEGPLAAH